MDSNLGWPSCAPRCSWPFSMFWCNQWLSSIGCQVHASLGFKGKWQLSVIFSFPNSFVKLCALFDGDATNKMHPASILKCSLMDRSRIPLKMPIVVFKARITFMTAISLRNDSYYRHGWWLNRLMLSMEIRARQPLSLNTMETAQVIRVERLWREVVRKVISQTM